MLLSYMNDSKGWVVLCKGHKLVFSGNGTKVVTTLESFKEWKQGLHKSTLFELLNQCYNEIKLPVPAACCGIIAQTNASWVHGDCAKLGMATGRVQVGFFHTWTRPPVCLENLDSARLLNRFFS